jgi:hypothetical protein
MGINLHADETIQSEGPAVLFEVQRQRGRSGGWVGANLRVGKSLTLRTGKFESLQTTQPTKTVPVASGHLYRTNQRIVFLGSTTEVEIETRNIISTDESGGRLTIYVHGRDTPYVLAPLTGDVSPSAVLGKEADRLLPDAISVLREYDRASASLLQARLKIGYARADRMIDQLETIGYLGPFDGSNTRQILRRDPLTAAQNRISSPTTPDLRGHGDVPAAPPPVSTGAVQRLTEAASQILATRPKGWEYSYFAFIRLLKLEELASKYRDHQLRMPRPSGDRVAMDNALAYATRATNELAELEQSFVALRSPNTWKTEIGAPDMPGDPERIRDLATRLNAVYEGLMDWAARIRGVNRPAELDSLFQMLARFADLPIEFYRESVRIRNQSTDDPAPGASPSKDSDAENPNRGLGEALTQSYLQEVDRLFGGK